MVPERARQRILDIAATQLPTGGAYHQYQPLTKRGNDAIGSGFNDDPAWLVLAVAAYLKETGDLAILDEPVAVRQRAGLGGSRSTTTCGARSTTRSTGSDRTGCRSSAGPTGTTASTSTASPRRRASRSRPTQNRERRRRRVGVHRRAVRARRRRARGDRREHRGDAGGGRPRCRSRPRRWWPRSTPTAGTATGSGARTTSSASPIGSAENDEGQIFVEPQGICVMAGVGLDDGRARRALGVGARATRDAARHRAPAARLLRATACELGEISSYPPGYKENAGIFCHTNPWLMIARGDRGQRRAGALDYYLRINPSAREAISDVHRCEPYVYAQMIAGPDAPTHGEAKNSWLTGTAAWNYWSRSPSGSWASGRSTTASGSTRAARRPGPGIRVTRRFRGVDLRIVVRARPDRRRGRVTARR